MKTKDIAYLSALEAINLFKKGTLSPVELLHAQINRIENFNDKINCMTYKHFDQAMEDAEESEKRHKNGNPRELEGITVAIKDKHDREGWVTTKGSLILKNAEPAKENDAIIDKLLEAGAVLHIQTTTPEFYLSGVTWSRLWGITRNPWNLAYSPGGSSGGSGAALAAGFTTLATGSDLGGSIRIPCSLCGLYGLKPPFGRVPSSETPYESSGPMARTFEDMVLLQNVISGPHPKVHSSIRPKLNYPREYLDVKGWKVAVDFAGGIGPLDVSVKKAMDQAIQKLQDIGCTVHEVDLGFTHDKFSIWANGLFATAKGIYLREASRHRELIMPYMARLVDKYSKVGPEEVARADALLTLYHRRVQDKIFNNGFKALIMPALMTPYIFADYGRTPRKNYFLVNGEKTYKSIFIFTWPWNLMGKYPVVNVPVGMGQNEIPVGMQIISNTFDDLTAFQLADAYSKVAPDFFKKKFPDFSWKNDF